MGVPHSRTRNPVRLRRAPKCHIPRASQTWVAREGGGNMAQRRILIFDLDGTLVDSAPDLGAAMNALLAELGIGGFPAASKEH